MAQRVTHYTLWIDAGATDRVLQRFQSKLSTPQIRVKQSGIQERSCQSLQY